MILRFYIFKATLTSGSDTTTLAARLVMLVTVQANLADDTCAVMWR